MIKQIFHQYYAKDFAQGAFLKNIAVLVSGTAVSQALTIAAAPILSRLYEPQAFGLYGLFTAILSIFTVASSWRYEVAIVLPGDDEEAMNILFLACSIVFFTSALALVLVAQKGSDLCLALGHFDLLPLLWWMPISILGVGTYQALSFWSTRRKYFDHLSISRLICSAVVVGTQTSAGMFRATPSGLVVGQFLGQTAASFYIGIRTWYHDKALLGTIKPSRVFQLLKEYRDFPIYSLPQSLVNTVSQNLPNFLLGYFYGIEIVGFYVLATRVLNLPVELISQSVRQVFFQKASADYQEKKDVYLFFRETTFGLVLIGLLPTIIAISLSPMLFRLVLGENWYTAGLYAQWIVIWLFFTYLNPPAVSLLQIYRMQYFLLIYEIVLLLLRGGILFIGGRYLTPLQSIACYSILGAIFNFLLIITVAFISKNAAQKNTNTMQSQSF